MNKRDLVGSAEAAAILGVKRVTVNRWAVDGKIPIAVQMSGETGMRLFNRADIEQLGQLRARARAKPDNRGPVPIVPNVA